MTHNQIKLPYEVTALEPSMSKLTLEYHYGKHYHTYLENFRKLTNDQPQFENASIYEVILHSDGALFNNAAQVVNHEMFFNQLTPMGKNVPTGVLLDAIMFHFGSFDEMKKLMTTKALTLFGSGWVWLALDDKNLVIVGGSNAYNPITESMRPLLAIDVWEHAYYLDYQNRRGDYLEKLWTLINWDVIEHRYVHGIEKKNTL